MAKPKKTPKKRTKNIREPFTLNIHGDGIDIDMKFDTASEIATELSAKIKHAFDSPLGPTDPCNASIPDSDKETNRLDLVDDLIDNDAQLDSLVTGFTNERLQRIYERVRDEMLKRELLASADDEGLPADPRATAADQRR